MDLTRQAWVERMLDVRDAAYVLGGLAFYGLRGQTPERAYQGMVRLFCRTGGHSNDLISRGVSRLHPPAELPSCDGVLGSLDASRRRAITEQLDRDGYYVFDERLDDARCAHLLRLAEATPCVAQGTGTDGGDELVTYDRRTPRAVRYELRPDDLVADPSSRA
jgi:hypothetical protein